ncbi:hypothetical protein [Daejeonella sp.]|uniref:hypothetical protein n=1 Tax=Daejeonella sp. TaxID=2805397 RepID=UPI0025C08155|nr:hypothetical protein [Daejeonella sp.]
MIIRNLTINNFSVWITIDQLRFYSNNRLRIESPEEFLCYFKLTEPTPMIIGELFKDEFNVPKLFNSADNALKYAEYELEKRLK